ncbi:unnamed protein product [Nippostrongylus brasiliensis]|uniref:Pseudouridine-5'-monophosphatase (inferred by orthology to a human protein) n=1 Tax=Nippostrongylus brasiliensis TaxID=27835 RepID=A0A0N4YT78_NIPBR|nr:unnamed protein product [Nippostrongylus brasiliensis]
MRKRPLVTHVIFDFDGLLVDTEPSYTLANEAMLKKFNREFTMDHKLSKCSLMLFLHSSGVQKQEGDIGISDMMGRKSMEAIAWLLEEVGISDRVTPEEYAVEYDDMLADLFRKCRSLPGAERLVRHFASKGVPMAICTGSCSRAYAQKAESHRDWLDLIPVQVSNCSSSVVLTAFLFSVDKVLGSLEEFKPEEFGLPAFD